MTEEYTEEDYERRHQKAEEFSVEFKALVRKYFPEYPVNSFEMDLLYNIQDRTSCFSPYIWSD